MNVLVVSHSYIVEENQKNIHALQEHARVKVVLPSFIHDRMFGRVTGQCLENGDYLVFRRLPLPRSQYILASMDLAMRSFEPDLIHVEYDPWSLIFWQAALYRWLYAPRAKIICTVKKNTYRKLPQPVEIIKNSIARFLIGKVAHFIAINQGVRDIYLNRFDVAEGRVSVIQHLGVDLTRFCPRELPRTLGEHEALIIGYCGRLDANKGIEHLLEAVGDLAAGVERRLCVRLLGSGELREALSKRAESWLQVLEPVPHSEVVNFLHGIDIFVLPSLITEDHQEHDAHALLEALACGVPAIGSSSGVIPEILDNGCGLIFEAGNVRDLKCKLSLLLDSPNLRGSLSERGVNAARRNFSLESIARKKMKIYGSLIA